MSEPALHICWGPSDLLWRASLPRERWCFGCKKRTWYLAEVWGDFDPSYYDPVWVEKCVRCRKDRSDFPGRG